MGQQVVFTSKGNICITWSPKYELTEEIGKFKQDNKKQLEQKSREVFEKVEL